MRVNGHCSLQSFNNRIKTIPIPPELHPKKEKDGKVQVDEGDKQLLGFPQKTAEELEEHHKAA